MRTFRPDTSLYRTFPDCHALTDQLHGLKIQFLNPNLPVPVIANALRIRTGSAIITFAVIVEKKARIDARGIVAEIIRLGPRSFRILRCDDKIVAVRHIGRDHIKQTIMIADRRRINTI